MSTARIELWVNVAVPRFVHRYVMLAPHTVVVVQLHCGHLHCFRYFLRNFLLWGVSGVGRGSGNGSGNGRSRGRGRISGW